MSNANILIMASLAGLATMAGFFIGRLSGKSKTNVVFGASFSGVLMVLIAVLELAPAAVKDIGLGKFFLWSFVGAFAIFLANLAIPHLHSIKEIKDCKDRCLVRMSYLIGIGLILHDFPEGFVISNSFSHSADMGFLVVAATFLHNIPEGYILTVSQTKSGKKDLCLRMAVFSLLATFLGAVLSINLLSFFGHLNPLFLSLATGAMIFISMHELIPESFRYKDFKTFASGIVSAIIVYSGLSMF